MPATDVDDVEISSIGVTAESLTVPVSDGLVERIVADARTTHVEPHPFTGLAERADVIIDLEIDNTRYILLRTAPQQQAPPTLSPRELEIARMVTKGLPNKSIATVLQISTWTVSSHLRRVFTKLGVNSRGGNGGAATRSGVPARVVDVRSGRDTTLSARRRRPRGRRRHVTNDETQPGFAIGAGHPEFSCAAPASAEVSGNRGRHVCILTAHHDHYVQDITVYTPDGVTGTLRAFVGDFRQSQDNTDSHRLNVNRDVPPGTSVCGGLDRGGRFIENVCVQV